MLRGRNPNAFWACSLRHNLLELHGITQCHTGCTAPLLSICSFYSRGFRISLRTGSRGTLFVNRQLCFVDPCTLAPPQALPTGNGFGFGLKTPEIISLHPQKNFAQNTKWSLHGNCARIATAALIQPKEWICTFTCGEHTP